MLIVVIVIGLLYALPNLFGEGVEFYSHFARHTRRLSLC